MPSKRTLRRKRTRLRQRERRDQQAQQRAVEAVPSSPNGVKSHDITFDNIKGAPTRGGTAADYLAARIARDQQAQQAEPPPRGAKAEPWQPGQSGNPAGHSRQRRAEAKLMSLILAKNAGVAVAEEVPDEVLATMLLSGMLTGNVRLFRFGLELLEG